MHHATSRSSARAVLETGCLVALTALALVAFPARASAQEAPAEESDPSSEPSSYVRHGFTMELGLGMSQTGTSSDVGGRDHSGLGLAPLSLGLGGFLTPRLALIGRAAGTSYSREDSRGNSYSTVNGFYGPTLQYWATDRVFLGGGVGLAVLAADLYGEARKDVRFFDTGIGLNARAGWAFALPGTHNAITLSIDGFASKFDKSTTVASALDLGWQFF